MCDCISYNRPELSGKDFAKSMAMPGESGTVEVEIDACISDTIQQLWDAGVRTLGCCCGHNGNLDVGPSVVLGGPEHFADAFDILSKDARDWRIMVWA